MIVINWSYETTLYDHMTNKFVSDLWTIVYIYIFPDWTIMLHATVTNVLYCPILLTRFQFIPEYFVWVHSASYKTVVIPLNTTCSGQNMLKWYIFPKFSFLTFYTPVHSCLPWPWKGRWLEYDKQNKKPLHLKENWKVIF